MVDLFVSTNQLPTPFVSSVWLAALSPKRCLSPYQSAFRPKSRLHCSANAQNTPPKMLLCPPLSQLIYGHQVFAGKGWRHVTEISAHETELGIFPNTKSPHNSLCMPRVRRRPPQLALAKGHLCCARLAQQMDSLGAALRLVTCGQLICIPVGIFFLAEPRERLHLPLVCVYTGSRCGDVAKALEVGEELKGRRRKAAHLSSLPIRAWVAVV